MENAGYFFAAFTIVWGVLFAYIFLLDTRQRQLKRKIESLKEKLKDK